MTHDHAPDSALDHLAHLTTEGERFAEAVGRGPLDAPIAACPGWDLAALAAHVGGVHRWARHAVLTGEAPTSRETPPADADGPALAAWIRTGLTALVTTLDAVDPSAPTWHPFPVPQVAGIWPRRQDQETTVHRWDAEAAIGSPTPIEAEFASDGIDEYFGIMLPRLVSREGLALPASTLHVHCTDTHGEWLVWAEGSAVAMRREHAKGAAALRGPAEALLLLLWGRPVDEGAVDTVGDPEAAAAWLALGGA